MPSAAVELLDLLEEERVAIRTSAFDVLEPIGAAKVQLFDQVTLTGASKEELAKIQSRLAANQALLASAIAGVNAARDRIEALQNVREGLNVYDRSGQMARVPTPRREMEKKA